MQRKYDELRKGDRFMMGEFCFKLMEPVNKESYQRNPFAPTNDGMVGTIWISGDVLNSIDTWLSE